MQTSKEDLNVLTASSTTNTEGSSGEKKSQEDSQILFESQENVFQKISAVFSQSSLSTNIGGELEETLLQAMDIADGVNDIELEESDCHSTYDLRTRTVVKQPVKKVLQTQTSRSPRLAKSGGHSESFSTSIRGFSGDKISETCCSPIGSSENTEIREDSQESVSMLQGYYHQNESKNDFPNLMDTCMDAEFEVINIYSDDDIEDSLVKNVDEQNEKEPLRSCAPLKVGSSSERDFPVVQSESSYLKETKIAKHSSFISSIIKLKTTLSSKKPLSDKKLWSILQDNLSSGKVIAGHEEDEEEELEIDSPKHSDTMPKETVDYLLRSSDVENVFLDTVQALLKYLEDALREDFFKLVCFWKNSVYEMAVEVLNQAVNTEVGIWKMMDLFLCRTIESILLDEGKSENLILESKTNFVISFCQSTHLSLTAINCVIGKLKKLKLIKRHTDSSSTEKISWMYSAKNSYFLLRILESSLDLLKNKIDKEKLNEGFIKEPKRKNYNVLEMWKKHWSRTEVTEERKTGHEWQKVVSEWCTELDEILFHCMTHVPILSMALGRCGELAKDILKMCHPE